MKRKLLLMTFMVLMGTMIPISGQNQITITSSIFVDGVQDPGNTWMTVQPNANPGDVVQLMIGMPLGYGVDDVRVTDTNNGIVPVYFQNNDYLFVMPADDVEVSVSYVSVGNAPNNVDIDPLIQNGVVMANPPTAAPGDPVKLDVFPNPGYVIDQVSVDVFSGFLGGSPFAQVYPDANGEYWFIMPDHNVMVTATFKLAPKIVDVDQGILGGTVAALNTNTGVGGPGMQTFLAEMGHIVQLSNTPLPGYVFNHYIVTNLDDGTDVLFTDGYPATSTNVNDFYMPGSDVNVTAVFSPVGQFTLRVMNMHPEGTVNLIINTILGVPYYSDSQWDYYWVNQNDVVQVTNTPSQPYYILSEYHLFDPYDPSAYEFTYYSDFTFTMPARDLMLDHDWYYTPPYQVTVNSSIVNGTVVPDHQYADVGDLIKLQITPAAGYQLITNSVYYVEQSPPNNAVQVLQNSNGDYEFIMPADDVEVTAAFRNPAANPKTLQVENSKPEIKATLKVNGSPVTPYWSDSNFDYYSIDENDLVEVTHITLPGYGLTDSYLHGGTYNAVYHSDFSFNMPPEDLQLDLDVGPVFPINITSTDGLTVAHQVNVNYNPITSAVDGSTVYLSFNPDPGYEFDPNFFTIFYNTTIQVTSYTLLPVGGPPYDAAQFVMPAGPVDVNVVYQPIPYHVYIDLNNPNGAVSLDAIDNLPPPTPTTTLIGNMLYLDYYPVYIGQSVTVSSTPATGYHFDQLNLFGDNGFRDWSPSTPYTFNMPAENVTVTADLMQDYTVDVMPVSHGTVVARYGTINLAYDPISGTQATVPPGGQVDVSWFPDPGYEFVGYEVYWITSTLPTTPLIPLNQTPYFNMNYGCVKVVPYFQQANYNVNVELSNSGGTMYAENYTARPHTGGANVAAFTAQMGDEIRVYNTPNGPRMRFAFYNIEDDYSVVIGQLLKKYKGFTMPPFNIRLSAVFYSRNSTPPTAKNPINMFTKVKTKQGVVYLHQHYAKKNTSGWDDPEYYGWSSAGLGESMYFTVAPDLGCQVKKSDITVKLVDISQDAEYVLSGDDISGPDEYVTGPTDYSFIFNAPAGVDPDSVEVDIDVDFTAIDYTITVDEDAIEHGTIEAPATANVDDVVTLTVTPEPGYRLSGITVTPEVHGFFIIEGTDRQFTMPASNVSVTATFEEAEFEMGDVNGDGDISIADVTTLIDYLLSGDISLINFDAADCHQDGDISIADVTALIDYLLSGSW
ncbi:MAG: dockerin type I repeat-containing protein [Muribaculaceae bacterium]|nr:dockerin type I repeat-containing protein [Muribaculaceae bacterium]